MAKKEATVEQLSEQARKEYEHWLYIRDNGCSDPFWPDGVNMNLIRNHILYDKDKIAEIIAKENPLFPPQIDDVPTPPRVDDNYMARRDDPRKNVRPISEDQNFVYDKPPLVEAE